MKTRKNNKCAPAGAQLSNEAIGWYRKHQRDLPFRRTVDPYAILVSEIMLQQTQVATATSYYARFLKRFPTIQSLAAAEEQDVLALWAGLGYYRRARLLHSAARQVLDRHGGHFPTSLVEIETLPGVGRYTAGAVYSFAYDLPAPIVEANTARLLARLFAIIGPLSSPTVRTQLWSHAERLLPVGQGREHNYALMELGALVCKPVPVCSACPLTSWCVAFQTGQTARIPEPTEKPSKLRRRFACIVLRFGDLYLVRRIPEGEWHHGMYEFPALLVEDKSTLAEDIRALRRLIPKAAGRLREVSQFANFHYTVTRHAVCLEVYSCVTAGAAECATPFFWKTLDEIASLPLGSAQRKLLDLVQSKDDLLAGVR